MTFRQGSENKNSGENVSLNKECSRLAANIAKQSWAQRHNQYGQVQDQQQAPFANALRFGELNIGISSDGIGTKIEVAERMQQFGSLGFDLMAMVVDDLAAQGFEPSNVSNVLDVDFLDSAIVGKLMTGLEQAAEIAHVALSGGEIAELGTRVAGWGTGMHLNWSATALGFLPAERKLVDATGLQAGDQLVALKSRGLRSNGFSLARRVLQREFGDNWHRRELANDLATDAESFAELSWGDYLLRPSRIFSPIIQTALQQGLQIHALAHLTGGGLLGALQRLLGQQDLGVKIDNLFAAPAPMKALQKMAQLDDSRAYRHWNMGQAFLVALPQNDVKILQNICTEHHCPCQLVGKISANPEIEFHSRGHKPDLFHFANSRIASGQTAT